MKNNILTIVAIIGAVLCGMRIEQWRTNENREAARLWYGIAMEWRSKYISLIDERSENAEWERGPVVTLWAPDSIDAFGHAFCLRDGVNYDLTGWEFHLRPDSVRIYVPYPTVKFRAGWMSFPRRIEDETALTIIDAHNTHIGGLVATSTD